MNTTTKLVSLIGLSVAVVAIAVYVMFNSLGTAIGTACLTSAPIQLWCSLIPIRKVNWRNPSSCLGNLNCQFYLDKRIPSEC